MDPVETLAADVQTLKTRFDEMSLRFAVSEEREKRVDDKIDNIAASIKAEMNLAVSSIKSEMTGVKKAIDDRSFVWRLILGAAVTVIAGAVLRWILSGSLAGF